MSAGTVSHVLGTPGTFGGHEALGFYVGDDLPKAQGRLLDYHYFGSTGMDVFNSYYYSYAATSRKYKESAKYLAEITFNGADAKNEILVAPGQSEDTVTRVANEDSAFEVMAAMKEHKASCAGGHVEYDNQTKELRQQYKNAKDQIIEWSQNSGDLTYKGAPGACENWFDDTTAVDTEKLRKEWNKTIEDMMAACSALWDAKKEYAKACGMRLEYKDPNGHNCSSLGDLKVNGGETPLVHPINKCWKIVKWTEWNHSPTFSGCNSRSDCKEKIPALYNAVESNIQLYADDIVF